MHQPQQCAPCGRQRVPGRVATSRLVQIIAPSSAPRAPRQARQCQAARQLRPVASSANRGGDASTSGSPEEQDSVPSQSSSTARFNALAQLVQNLDGVMDLNQLHTALTAALEAEEYQVAARLRDRIAEVMGGSAQRIDWGSLGLEPWVAERAERLGFRFPSEIQRRTAPVILSGLDAIVQSETGSGKTLSFLVPTLSKLDYPPKLYLDDLKGPQAVVVVPTMELGVQCALTVYKLLGGNLSQRRPGDAANIFTYTGPRGIKVRGVLNKEEVAMAKGTEYLKGVHVVVGTPAALVDVYSGNDRRPVLDHLKVLVVDEYDECFRQGPEAMSMLMSCTCQNNASGSKPQVVLVGATITPNQIQLAVQAGWIHEPVHVLVGKEGSIPSGLQHRYVVCEAQRKLAVLTRLLRRDLELLGDDPVQPARAMVFANSTEEAAAATEPLRSALWGDHRMAVLVPPGTRIPPPPGSPGPEGDRLLSQDMEDAKEAARHELADASPFSASDPIRAMHSFRDNRTTLLLCTPQAARGLDLPAVSHVYNLGAPSDGAQYLHRAGRAGRIGSTTGGIVTTLVTEAELPHLLELAKALKVELQASEAPESSIAALAGEVEEGKAADVEKLRKGLEDLYNLL